jgi:aminoglycoside phosphotransferase family enzyme
MKRIRARGKAADLATKVRFLKRRASYAERPKQVASIETHMSWVFLTDEHAYKLKKPVRQPFLDFGTVEARRRNCALELRLNRRLAPDVYLGLVPIRIDKSGRLSLEGSGEIVDWLVKMRRLPAERTLGHAIAHRTVRPAELRRVVAALARFYRGAPKARIAKNSYRRRFEANIRTNRSELSKPRWRLPIELVRKATEAQLAFLRRRSRLLDARVRDRRIVEAHGDLRPEHVYLGPKPVITDCLEFNRAFRILDPADELAYLALECEMLGDAETGRRLLDLYEELSRDRPPDPLLRFYMSERACLRAKLAIWHLKDRTLRHRAKWRRKALRYLRLACSYADAFAEP